LKPQSQGLASFRIFKPLRRAATGLLLLAVLIAIGSSFISDHARAVKTITVQQGPLVTTVSVTGKAVTAREVGLSATAPGTIATVHVKEGDVVQRGQALASLDVREARALESKIEAGLRQANEEFAQAQRVLERARKLYEIGGESRQAVEDAGSRLRIAEAKVLAAREDLRVGRLGLQNSIIRAPFGGLITSVTAQVGQWAIPGGSLVTLAAPNEREIDAKVDAGDGGVIHEGQEALVTSDAFPDRQWRERVLRLAPAMEKGATTNSFSVRLSLGRDAPPLRLGQQLDVKIQVASKADAVKVPTTALVTRNDGVAAVLNVRDGRIHFVPVRTGIEDLSHTEIVSELRPGDPIVLPEKRAFVEGERVKAVAADRP